MNKESFKTMESSLHAANSSIAQIYEQIHTINNHLQRHEFAIGKINEHLTILLKAIESNHNMIVNCFDIIKISAQESDPGLTGQSD